MKSSTSIKYIEKSIKYLLIGSFATGLYLGCTYIFTEYLAIYYVYSAAIAFTISTTSAFFAHKYVTFSNREKKHVQQFISFVIVAISGLAINTLGLMFFVEKLGLWYVIGAAITSGIVFVWNFFLNDLITFRPSSNSFVSTSDPDTKT